MVTAVGVGSGGRGGLGLVHEGGRRGGWYYAQHVGLGEGGGLALWFEKHGQNMP